MLPWDKERSIWILSGGEGSIDAPMRWIKKYMNLKIASKFFLWKYSFFLYSYTSFPINSFSGHILPIKINLIKWIDAPKRKSIWILSDGQGSIWIPSGCKREKICTQIKCIDAPHAMESPEELYRCSHEMDKEVYIS